MTRDRKTAKRLDPRVRYTRMVFRDSLMELMRERPVAEIGIKELCAAAGVSRSTFYAYYADVNDLLAQIEEETIRYFEGEVDKLFSQSYPSRREMEAVFERFLRYIVDNGSAMRVLLSENGDRAFQENFFQKFIGMARGYMKKTAGAAAPDDVFEAYSVFVVHGAVGLVRYWLKTNMRIPIPDMAKMLSRLTAVARE